MQPTRPADQGAVVARTPVQLVWHPPLPMWMEVRQGGSEVASWSSRTVPSGERLALPAGRYEVKVRRGRGFACADELMLDVVGE